MAVVGAAWGRRLGVGGVVGVSVSFGRDVRELMCLADEGQRVALVDQRFGLRAVAPLSFEPSVRAGLGVSAVRVPVIAAAVVAGLILVFVPGWIVGSRQRKTVAQYIFVAKHIHNKHRKTHTK